MSDRRQKIRLELTEKVAKYEEGILSYIIFIEEASSEQINSASREVRFSREVPRHDP